MKINLRRDAVAIFNAGVAAANPAAMVEEALRRRRDLDRYERIFVVGGGKAGGTMARAAERVLGRRITAGCVAVRRERPNACWAAGLPPAAWR
jgi:glycerate 2-kinase